MLIGWSEYLLWILTEILWYCLTENMPGLCFIEILSLNLLVFSFFSGHKQTSEQHWESKQLYVRLIILQPYVQKTHASNLLEEALGFKAEISLGLRGLNVLRAFFEEWNSCMLNTCLPKIIPGKLLYSTSPWAVTHQVDLGKLDSAEGGRRPHVHRSEASCGINLSLWRLLSRVPQDWKKSFN